MIGDIKNATDIKTLLEINIISFINQFISTNSKKEPAPVENIKEEKIKNEKSATVVENTKVTTENISQEIISNPNIIEVDNDYNEKVINNCFARANKTSKQEFEKMWVKISEYALDNEFGAIASFLSDGNIRVVGDGEVLLSFGYESMVNRGLNMLYDIKKLIKKIYNKDYDVALITNDNWNIIKQKYVDDKNNGKEYIYIPIELKEQTDNIKKSSNDDSIASQAIELFGEDIISVN